MEIPCFLCGFPILNGIQIVGNANRFIRCNTIDCYERCIETFGRFPPPVFPQSSINPIKDVYEKG